MKKKLLIILLTILIIVSLIITSIYIIYNKIYIKNIKTYANSYYNDYGEISTVTSINVLDKLGYIPDNIINKVFKGNGCKIISLNSNSDAILKDDDCALSKKLETIPYFSFIVTNNNGDKIDNYTNINYAINISVLLKNNIDNLEYEWYNGDNLVSSSNILNIDNKESGEYVYTLYLKNKDKVYSRNIVINIDYDKPILQNKQCSEYGFFAIYEDNSGITSSLYYVSENNTKPEDVTLFKKIDNLKIDNNKLYYIYAVGVDKAGNYSDIEYLGEYQRKTVTVGN